MNLSGILVVNKPSGVTSHDLVQRLRQILRTRRIGHTGTLDPQASGVLLACVGKATKVAQFLTPHDKEYEAEIKLGVTTDTYDSHGKVKEIRDELNISADQIRKAVDSFKGRIWQVPPLHSAIQYKGKRLYQYARAGKEVRIKRREVEIKHIQVVEIEIPYVKLRIGCSKGTYIRSLAHDLGQKLGCGACLFSLRRTRVGPFKLQEAADLEEVSDVENESKLRNLLIPIERALDHLPSVVVKAGFGDKVRQGAPLVSSSLMSVEADFEESQSVSIKDHRKSILAIGKALRSSNGFLDQNPENKLFEYIRVI